jgi:hypothetical protein
MRRTGTLHSSLVTEPRRGQKLTIERGILDITEARKLSYGGQHIPLYGLAELFMVQSD